MPVLTNQNGFAKVVKFIGKAKAIELENVKELIDKVPVARQ